MDQPVEDEVVKDKAYHEAAIEYNEKLMTYAAELAPSIQHPVPRKWCLSVARQHRYHLNRHLRSLNRLRKLEEGATVESEDGGEDRVVDDEHIAHRSAESGQFITGEEAEENPATTVEETIALPAQPIEETGPDPEKDAEPIETPELTEQQAQARYEAALAEAKAAEAEEENPGE